MKNFNLFCLKPLIIWMVMVLSILNSCSAQSEWSDVNYELLEINCLFLKGPYIIINSQQEYQAILDNRFPSTNCMFYEFPEIDFQYKTLICVIGSTGGDYPRIKLSVLENNKIIYVDMILYEKGNLRRENRIMKWLLVDKMSKENIKVTVKNE